MARKRPRSPQKPSTEDPMFFNEGDEVADEMHPVHREGGLPKTWMIGLHYGDAGVASTATGMLDYDTSPEEPIAALLTDLGPIAMQDYEKELNNSDAPGAHLHSQISSRSGAWFNWYNDIVDPSARSATELAELKAAIRDALLGAVADAL